MDIPVSMKLAGWITLTTPVAAIFTTTDTAVRFRSSKGAANSTYGLVRTKNTTLDATTLTNGMVHTYLWLRALTRDNTPFVGNLEIWVRKEASTVTFGNQNPLLFLDYLPGFMEVIYD